MAQAQSQCGACERFRSPFSPENTTGLKGPFCAAFPDGIPEIIFHNDFDHRAPFENDHGLQWVSRGGIYPFPSYAFNPDVLTGPPDEPLVAATNLAPDGTEHTGAMVALLPTPEHAARLAVDGGEPADQLHCTLVFLGEALDFDPTDRELIAKWATEMAQNWATVEAEAFAPALFNPTGEEPCAVLVLSGAELAEFYETALADITDLVGIAEQHQPYVPHVTIKYLDVASAAELDPLLSLVGPIVFDRIRVAFGGEVIDVPLGDIAPEEEASPEELIAASGWTAPDGVSSSALVGEPVAASGTEVYLPFLAVERERFDGCPYCGEASHAGPCSV